MRTALGIAGLAVVIGTLAGCGGDSGGDESGAGDEASSASTALPANASKEDFCANFEKLASDLSGLTEDDAAEAVSTLQDAADQMAATGTPAGITDDARHGLEVTLDALQGLPDDASVADISNVESTLSDADKKDADAFDKYLDTECGNLG